MPPVIDIPFDEATEEASIRYRIAPIDVGFDLRRQKTPVEITHTDDPIRISYADAGGTHRVISGPQKAVLARLRKLGYRFHQQELQRRAE